MAMLWTFHALSLCRHVYRELLRSAVLDVHPIIPATACHQRNYVERYSRYQFGGGPLEKYPSRQLAGGLSYHMHGSEAESGGATLLT